MQPVVPFSDQVLRCGSDITIAATSWSSVLALRAADILSRKCGVDAEVINLYYLKPLTLPETHKSVRRTGALVTVEDGWLEYGIGSEVIARTSPRRSERIGWEDGACPTARHLENRFYHNSRDIVTSACSVLGINVPDLDDEPLYSHENKFRGPF